MEKLKIDIILVKKILVPRQTENVYYQDLKYEHLWKEGDKIENIFIVFISDQFYNPETKKELVNSMEVHFRIITSEKVLHGYTDPENRHNEAIPLIASMTHKALEILRADSLKIFDKSQFKDIELPTLTEQQVFHIVQKSLPQMDKSKMPITLVKENWVASYIITMFSIIDEATSDKEIIIEGAKITIKTKEKDEIFEFHPDHLKELKGKIFEGFFSNPAMQYLELTKEESDLFRQCSHAAYYFETERNQIKNKGLRNDFLELHGKFFNS